MTGALHQMRQMQRCRSKFSSLTVHLADEPFKLAEAVVQQFRGQSQVREGMQAFTSAKYFVVCSPVVARQRVLAIEKNAERTRSSLDLRYKTFRTRHAMCVLFVIGHFDTSEVKSCALLTKHTGKIRVRVVPIRVVVAGHELGSMTWMLVIPMNASYLASNHHFVIKVFVCKRSFGRCKDAATVVFKRPRIPTQEELPIFRFVTLARIANKARSW